MTNLWWKLTQLPVQTGTKNWVLFHYYSDGLDISVKDIKVGDEVFYAKAVGTLTTAVCFPMPKDYPPFTTGMALHHLLPSFVMKKYMVILNKWLSRKPVVESRISNMLSIELRRLRMSSCGRGFRTSSMEINQRAIWISRPHNNTYGK